MDNGILLLSIGHPAYARWAHNMAVSIRANMPDAVIHIITDGNYPAEPYHMAVVDKLIKIDYSDCHEASGRLFPAKAKLSIYKYSEFEKTIYLDVDGIVIKDLNPLFDLPGYFQVQVNGISTKEHDNLDASLWVPVSFIFDKYVLPDDAKIPGTNSSFEYFVKGDDTAELFNRALDNLNDPFPLKIHRYKWGHSTTQPDELYLNIALAQMGYIPNMEPVLYLRKRNEPGGHVGLDTIQKDRYIIGCWGDRNYNHFEISGTGDRSTGLYNKCLTNYYNIVYNGEHKFTDHFHLLINDKVYSRAIK